ncbi:MAG: restriction endonuclease subunit S, partial [Bacteroidales bacterium]|nr:restriction endonuclease subunit S [Bacteroidales bacterium]
LEQHFDTAFAAPDGIKKLRELILTLAMQGKLVEQDPNDPPASELLKEIEAEKQRLVNAGAIKYPKPLLPIKSEELFYDLPKGWELARFGALVQVLNGRAYKQNEILGSGTPVLRVGNLFTSNKWYYSDIVLDDDKYIDTGDLIYAWSASFGPFIWSGNKVIYHYHIWKLKFYSQGQPLKEYLYHYLHDKTDEIKLSGSGIAMIHMTKERMENLLVPLPPLTEQHRIVARIDQLMVRCDELEKLRNQREEKRLAVHAAAIRQLLDAPDGSAWDFIQQYFNELYSVKENVAELRKAILQLAVTGKLVPQDPNDPPASELLKEIEAEKHRLIKAGKIKKQKSLPPIKQEEMPYEMPNGWEWVRFGDLTTEIATGPFGSMIHKSDYVFDGIPLINPSHMIDGKIVQDQSISVSKKIAQKLSSYKLCENDIVMARRGEMGRCAVVNNLSDGFLCGTGSFVLRFIDKLNRQYILNMFKTENVQEYLGGNSVGTTMTNLNHNILNHMPMLLPPLPEQHRIIARIDQLMALCDQLDQQINAATGKQTELLNAVMAQVE